MQKSECNEAINAEVRAEREPGVKEEFPVQASRLISVTIASWILIIWASAVLALIAILVLYSSNDRKQALTSDALLSVACLQIILWFGIGMRRGLRWARLLWLWFVPAVIAFIHLTKPDGRAVPTAKVISES